GSASATAGIVPRNRIVPAARSRGPATRTAAGNGALCWPAGGSPPAPPVRPGLAANSTARAAVRPPAAIRRSSSAGRPTGATRAAGTPGLGAAVPVRAAAGPAKASAPGAPGPPKAAAPGAPGAPAAGAARGGDAVGASGLAALLLAADRSTAVATAALPRY